MCDNIGGSFGFALAYFVLMVATSAGLWGQSCTQLGANLFKFLGGNVSAGLAYTSKDPGPFGVSKEGSPKGRSFPFAFP